MLSHCVCVGVVATQTVKRWWNHMEDVTAGHDIQTYEWRKKCGNQTRRRRDFTQQNLQQQHRCVIMSKRGEKKDQSSYGCSTQVVKRRERYSSNNKRLECEMCMSKKEYGGSLNLRTMRSEHCNHRISRFVQVVSAKDH